MSEKTFKKLDTFSSFTALVRLAQDPKVFKREDGSHDVVLTFCDSSRFDNHEDLWIDARMGRTVADRSKKLRKGDQVQISGKLRFKKQNDGTYRGKIFDAQLATFTPTMEREDIEPAGEPTFE
jgi:single-stranded DNA-binding protein